MFELWINNIFVIPMGTNCAPLLADLFLYWYEFHFIYGDSQEKLREAILILELHVPLYTGR